MKGQCFLNVEFFVMQNIGRYRNLKGAIFEMIEI